MSAIVKKALKKVVKQLTPPIIYSSARKIIKSRNPLQTDAAADEYIRFISYILGGYLTPKNVLAFDHAVRHMPSRGAVIEIGSLLGLSTNIIAYLLLKHQRNNAFFTCDPWKFESTGQLVGGYFNADSEAYRDYAKNLFKKNTELFSEKRKPYAIERFSDIFFELWDRNEQADDVFGRQASLGGPISFGYIDGAHDYRSTQRDFFSIDKYILPGGFILFDDSAGAFEGVTRVVNEVERDASYELVSKNPNYFFRKRDTPAPKRAVP